MAVHRYTSGFFKRLQPESRRTAEIVTPLILELLHPSSVVDVGCGTGDWLAVLREAGLDDVFGVDGEWMETSQLQIPVGLFQAADLSQPFTLPRKFDLAMCLEVAEHLPAQSADSFVRCLVALAPAVLFSAAIPFQGGSHHVNEQWPDYWQARFLKAGHVLIDCFRRQLWNRPGVQPYIAQNLLLFVAPEVLASNDRLQAESAKATGFPIRVVHPGIYQIPSVRRLLGLMRRPQPDQPLSD